MSNDYNTDNNLLRRCKLRQTKLFMALVLFDISKRNAEMFLAYLPLMPEDARTVPKIELAELY